MSTTQEAPKRPKNKQLRMRKKENESFLEWLDNQNDFSDSIRKLIETHVNRYGTKDINHPDVVFGMARDMVLLSGQTISAPTQQIEEVPSIQTENIVQEEVKKEVEKRDIDLEDF